MSTAHLLEGRYTLAIAEAERSRALNDGADSVYWLLVTCHMLNGDEDQARAYADRFRSLFPNVTASGYEARLPFRRTEMLRTVGDCLRAAGLPD